jgi:hypothetical protein
MLMKNMPRLTFLKLLLSQVDGLCIYPQNIKRTIPIYSVETIENRLY